MERNNQRKVKVPFDWMPDVEIKELGPCKWPRQSDRQAIGYDLYVPTDTIVPAHSRIVIPLNFALNLPRRVEAKIEARSGFSLKGMEGFGKRKRPVRIFGRKLWNVKEYCKGRFDADVISGKIDPGYHDNIGVIVVNHDDKFVIEAGTKIAQMTFYRVLSPQKFIKKDTLTGTDRGGGFGHSGTV